MGRLDRSQRAALLLHELVHIQRGDHWCGCWSWRFGVAYWWLPVVGSIGRQLRACEEACCDAAVVAHLPQARRDYARLLLDVLDFADPLPGSRPTGHRDECRQRSRTAAACDSRRQPGNATHVAGRARSRWAWRARSCRANCTTTLSGRPMAAATVGRARTGRGRHALARRDRDGELFKGVLLPFVKPGPRRFPCALLPSRLFIRSSARSGRSRFGRGGRGLVLTCRGASAQEAFEGWNLEPGVGQAHLVMVARVASISQLTVVEGAKTDVALREYRFQPIRRLKGIFQRDQLSMTAADWAVRRKTRPWLRPLKEGEFRLLILAQQQGSVPGLRVGGSGRHDVRQRVPLLTGPDDPLVAVVETLIQVADSRSRRERATLLVERLEGVDGLAAVPLLSSLRLRADWAAADERALPALARLVRDPSTAVRGAALEVLRDILASRIMPKDPRQLDGVAEARSRAVLNRTRAITRVRLAALEALGHLLALEGRRRVAARIVDRAVDHRRDPRRAGRGGHGPGTDRPAASGRRGPGRAGPAAARRTSGRESAYARAAVRLDAAGAERVLLARLERSIRRGSRSKPRSSCWAGCEARSPCRSCWPPPAS